MLKSLFRANCMPIGLDVGTLGIKMLQLTGRGKDLSVVASGYYEFPSDVSGDGAGRQEMLAEGCRKLLGTYSFVGRNVVSCLPVGVIQYKNMRLPQMPGNERRMAVGWEASERFTMDVKEAKVEYLYAGDVRQGDETREEIIVMAVPDMVLREHVQMLTESGLEPVAIDSPPTAMARCFSRFIRRESDNDLIRTYVDIGRSCSKVMIMRGKRIIFFKLIDIGGEHLDRSVADHLGLSLEDVMELRRRMSDGDRCGGENSGEDEEALFGRTRKESVRRAVHELTRTVIGELAKEIGMCLRYYSVTFRGPRPEELYLLGGEAHDPMCVKVISEQLEVEVKVAKPLEGIDLSSSEIAIERRSLLPEWGTVLGLALRSRVGGAGKRGAA